MLLKLVFKSYLSFHNQDANFYQYTQFAIYDWVSYNYMPNILLLSLIASEQKGDRIKPTLTHAKEPSLSFFNHYF